MINFFLKKFREFFNLKTCSLILLIFKLRKMSCLKKILFLFLITGLFCGCFPRRPIKKHAHYELGFSLLAPENWQRADIGSLATVSSLASKTVKKA